MSQISQSRSVNRGPLIVFCVAVIKIELASNNIDRIFLHQNDDDYKLAEEFQQKHHLSAHLIDHIHQRIQMSRMSLQSTRQIDSQKQNWNEELFTHSKRQQPTEQKNIRSFVPTIEETELEEEKLFTPKQQAPHQKSPAIQKMLNQYIQTKQQIPKTQKYFPAAILSKVNQTSVSNSFEEGRPSNVRILRKQDLSSGQESLRRSFSKSQLSRITKNVTNRLYNEDQIKKKYLEKVKKRAEKKESEKEEKQLTHKPRINPISKIMAEGRYQGLKVEDYLAQEGKKIQKQRQESQTIKEQKQLQACSFHPSISIISRKLALDRSLTNLPQRQACSKHKKNQNNFVPSINKVSRQMIKNKGNFESRLKNYLQNKNMKLNEMAQQKRMNEKVDGEGKELYRPRISSKRQPKGKQIYNYLYEQKKNIIIEQESRTPQINQKSERIVESMHRKRIAWLFTQLDSDQDGFISPKRINIETISEELLEIIMPVLFQMEEMNIQLSLSDFAEAIQNLHSSLNTLQKSTLYQFKPKEKIR